MVIAEHWELDETLTWDRWQSLYLIAREQRSLRGLVRAAGVRRIVAAVGDKVASEIGVFVIVGVGVDVS